MCSDNSDKEVGGGIKYTQSPEYDYQMSLFKDIQDPYMKSQYKLYTDTYAPAIKSTGEAIAGNLADPTALPEGWDKDLFSQDYWDKTWQQGREKALAEYAPIERQTSRRAAATGGIGQGPANALFADIEASKAKSIETMAIQQAIDQYKEMKDAKMQAYSLKQNAMTNSLNFLTTQPTFNIPMPTSQAYIPQMGENEWAKAGSAVANTFMPYTSVGATIGSYA